jgi:hypothetical protein
MVIIDWLVAAWRNLMAKFTVHVPKKGVFLADGQTIVDELGTVNVQFAASGGIPPYTYSMVGNPPWVTLTSAGLLVATPPIGSNGIDYVFDVFATDSKGAKSN